MSMLIGFRNPTKFLRRNGVAKMGGIHVSRHSDALYIAPITSNAGWVSVQRRMQGIGIGIG